MRRAADPAARYDNAFLGALTVSVLALGIYILPGVPRWAWIAFAIGVAVAACILASILIRRLCDR